MNERMKDIEKDWLRVDKEWMKNEIYSKRWIKDELRMNERKNERWKMLKRMDWGWIKNEWKMKYIQKDGLIIN